MRGGIPRRSYRRSPRRTGPRPGCARAAFSAPAALAALRALAALAALTALAVPPAALAAPAVPLPKVASINLCTDQLLLELADPRQILTLSWLSADPEESMLAAQAAAYPANYGTAEELLRYDPDVVLAGTLTSAFTRKLLERLGYRVVEIPPARSVEDIAANLERVAAAVGRPARGAAAAAALRARRDTLARAGAGPRVGAVVLRPGGFTVGRDSLAQELMQLAGLDNLAADRGLDRWGSLSVETLLRSRPRLLIVTDYRRHEASLANAIFDHPAVERIAAQTATLELPAAEWGCGLPESLDSVAAMQRAAAPLRPAVALRTRADRP